MSELPKLIHWRDFSSVKEGDVIEMDAMPKDNTIGWFQSKHIYETLEKLGLDYETYDYDEGKKVYKTMKIIKKNE